MLQSMLGLGLNGLLESPVAAPDVFNFLDVGYVICHHLEHGDQD